MINGIDYNGRRGAHPKLNGVSICDCIKHVAARNANPMQIQGANPITTQNIDPQIIASITQSVISAMQATNATPENPMVNIPQAPVNNIPMQTEYIAPINVDASGKGMAKITDARIHAEPKFTDGIHDFRFAKVYVSKSIVANGTWELVLRKTS